MNQSVVAHLLELRNQYRVKQLESEQRKHHLAQQLSHVDALLVDHLESTNLVESLVELRHQYQQQIAECDRTVAHCQDQLIHVNALLADQIVEQHEHLTLRATVEQQRSRAFAGSASLSRTLAQQSQERSLTESPESVDEEMPEESGWEKGLDEPTASATDETVNGAANSSFQAATTEELTTELEQAEPESNNATSELLEELEAQSSPEATENSVTAPESFESSSPDELPRETPLLPQYQHLTKSEALRQLMEDKAGSALHIDWLLRELYGDLDEERTAAERKRLNQILTDGIEQGLWEKVAGAPECYTINHELVEPELDKKTQKPQVMTQSTSSRQPGLTVLPKYSGASLIDAVELILAEQAGEELTIEQVTKELFGKVTGQKFSQAKGIVGGALKRGVESKRFIRVAGKKGVYTLEARIVKPASGAEDTSSEVKEVDQVPLKFLPAYEGMSFINAAFSVMREHVGKVMTPEQVARALYGDELSGVRLATAKHKVNRVLWEGASRKKWRRLTGVMGRYTLDQ